MLTKLAKHNTLDSAWVCVQGIIYDITNYVAKHPGGKIIMDGAGKDATSLYSKLHLTQINIILGSMLLSC